MRDELLSLPMVPLRGLVAFPYTVLNFEIGRPTSMAAVHAAAEDGEEIFLVMQKDKMCIRDRHTACNVLAALCCIFIFSQPIWNAAFVEQINAIYPIGEGYSFLSRLWKYFQEYFPVFLLACFLFETLNAWVRALRLSLIHILYRCHNFPRVCGGDPAIWLSCLNGREFSPRMRG